MFDKIEYSGCWMNIETGDFWQVTEATLWAAC